MSERTVPTPMPTHVLAPAELRDVELALFGALGDGHVLGGPVTAGADPTAATQSSRVLLALPVDPRARTLAHGAVQLLDDELTPIARLTAVTDVRDATGTSDGLVSGTLVRERWRESGSARDHALTDSDVTGLHADAVLVLGRPPVDADAEALAGLTAQTLTGPQLSPRTLLVAVPDRPEDTQGVPTGAMLSVATGLVARLGRQAEAQLRVIPLARRDKASDRALAHAFAARVGARAVVLLGVGERTPADTTWQGALATLQRGTDLARIPALAADDERLLRRWRRPRRERGLVLMFSGLSGSGKSTLARGAGTWLERHTDRTVSLLDGDVVRRMLSSGLGFDRESRILNVRRIGYVGAEVARHGGVAICAPIAPYASTRAEVRAMAEAVGDFVLVHVSTPIEECERRDLKGLYAKARAGLIPEFTGVSDPYDVPADAEVVVDTSTLSPADAVRTVADFLRAGGWVTDTDPTSSQGTP